MAFPTGWGRRCALVIQESKISDAGGDLTDFPVLLTKDNLPSAENGMFDADGTNPALEGGGDIRFSSDDAGSSQLACEVVAFSLDDANDLAEIWVCVPTVDKDGDTTIYVWYDKSGESQPARDAAYGMEAVWDANFKGVWHLTESGDGSDDEFKDSTSNDNHGTGGGAKGSGDGNKTPDQINGKVYKGQSYVRANDDQIVVLDDATLDVGTNTDFTISQWIYFDSASGDAGVASKRSNAGDQAGWIVFRDGTTLYDYIDWGGGTQNRTSTVAQATWYHHVFTVDRDGNMTQYMNGSPGTPLAVSGNDDIDNASNFYIGYNPGDQGNYLSHDGILEEFRFSAILRSAEWIGAEYENQNDPGAFVVEGTPESPAATQTLSSAGAIASLEGFGTSKANFGLSPSAIGSLEAFGTSQLDMKLTASSIASGEGFGTPTFLLKLLPSAISSLEALGSPQLNLILPLSAIASAEAFGTLVTEQELFPYPTDSEEAFGTPDLQWVLGPSGISSAEAFGLLVLATAIGLLPSGIGSSEGFGIPVFDQGIFPYSTDSEEVFGDPVLEYLNLLPSGIASLEGFGSHQVNLRILGEAISSAEAFGTLTLATMASIYPSGIASLEDIGSAFLYLLSTVHPSAIGSSEVFGVPKLTKYLIPSGIASSEVIGALNLILAVQNIFPDGIPSGEAFGITQLISRLIRKAVAEAIGFKEKILRSSRTYSGGEDNINRILSSIWEDVAKEETTWETTKKIQKDE